MALIDTIRAVLHRELAPTIRRVNLMVARGVVRAINDSGGMQRVQLSLLEDEVADDVEMLQPFGLSFVPPSGSEVVALAVGGNRDHLFALGASSRVHRPAGAASGEGGLYTLTGWKVFCDADGNVFIGADEAGGAVYQVARADLVEAELASLWDALNGHQHAETGGTTDAPTGAPLGAAGAVGSSKVKVVE